MQTQEIQIESLAPWSEPQTIETKRGWRILRKAPPTEEFWTAWRAGKQQLKEAGISVGKDNYTGEWQLCWWQDPPKEFTDKLNERIQGSQAVDADIKLPAPDGFDYLGYQKAGIIFAYKVLTDTPPNGHGNGVLIGDEMGLGKTIQAIGVLNIMPNVRKVLVVCPASLKLNWRRELIRWLMRDMSIGVASPKCFPSKDIVIMNYDILTKFELAEDHFDMVIADECHWIKNPKAKRTKALKAIPNTYRVALTGTPIPNRINELFEVINWLQPREFPNYYKFLWKYMGGNPTVNGNSDPRLQRLQRRLRETLMARRLKRDVLTDLPPKMRQVIEIPSDHPCLDAEQSVVKQNEDTVMRLKINLELAKVSGNDDEYYEALQALKEGVSIAFEEMARVRRETAIAKIPLVLEHVLSIVNEGHKCVCFAHHREVLERLRKSIPNSVLLYGGMSDEAKQAAVDKFQNDAACPAFFGGMKAAGVGITLTASSHVVFAEEDWVPSTLTQCEDRCHRIGTKDSVTVQHIVLEGSIDANMAHTIVSKQRIIDQALDANKEGLEEEPIIPSRNAVNAVTITVKEAELKAAKLTPLQVSAVHRGLQLLAGVCDGARKLDDMGFNCMDAAIGRQLSLIPELTPRQAVLGQKLVRKYRRQLPEELLKEAL